MNSTRKRLQVVLAGMGAVVFGAAAFAWACTDNASISAFPKSGPAGSVANVDGAGYHDGPVELRWDSVNGPVLAVTDGPRFLTPIEIPQAGPGVHKIVAVHIAMGGVEYNTAPFTVTLPEAPTSPPKQQGGGSSQAEQGQPQGGQLQSEPQAGLEAAGAGTVSFSAPESSGSDRATAVGSTAGGSAGALENGTIDVPPVSERSAFGDATGGFSGGAAPSLTEGATGVIAAESDSPVAAAGLALLVLGLGALLASGLVVASRRRHAPAAVEHDGKS